MRLSTRPFPARNSEGLPLPSSEYADAGVDVRKVGRIHLSLAEELGKTFTNRKGKTGGPLIPIGHYAGLIDLGGSSALALHTDGVGTKVLIAQLMKKFDTIGIDCVAMTVNDLVCLGAEPVALLDYIALQRENQALVSQLTKGLAEGAKLASTAIVGGETAILGGMVKGTGGNGFDLVSMGVGLVGKSAVIDGSKIENGDAVLGVASSGLHSNGYTLARKVLRRRSLDEKMDELGTSLGEALLTPTCIYVKPVLSATRKSEVHGIGHITGGSFAKLARLVRGRRLKFELELPLPPPIFGVLQREGRLADIQMYETFNMGIGLCMVVPESELGSVARGFRRDGFDTYDLGNVRTGRGVTVNGTDLG
ncbi:MAG: phosphoribosylformylglycinamidine cyclo-ligase [Thaumarchaeota archaeon]|nr:MAG: phosphoribosylformylglycinamidine cyclo-ligase [Nitrososphaerota archaeon]